MMWKKNLENIEGRGGNLGSQRFLPFHYVCYPIKVRNHDFPDI